MKRARTRRVVWISVAAVVAVVVVGLGSLVAYAVVQYGSIKRYSTAPGEPVTVKAHRVGGLGTVLVTGKGYALYMFPPDHRQRVTCTDSCAGSWPPLLASAGTGPVAGRGVDPSLLDTVSNPGGGRVVTYNGWPLYTFAGDLDPLRATGQAIDESGGYWYVLRPSGRPVVPRDRATASHSPPASITTHARQAATVEIKTRKVPGLGTVLVNAEGRTLYMFPPDHRQRVTCTGPCAGTWPPVTVPPGGTPAAGAKVDGSLLATVSNPTPRGGRVVTYNGWPLYTYAADLRPGQALGQALDLNGGYWYALRPSGQIVKTTP